MRDLLLLGACAGFLICNFYLVGRALGFLEQVQILTLDGKAQREPKDAKMCMDGSEKGTDRESGTVQTPEAAQEKKAACSFARDILKSLGILILATCIGFWFHGMGIAETNIITIYILGVLIISVVTTHRAYSLLCAAGSVLIFNFFFTMPRFTLRAYDERYSVTFLVMFVAAFLTGTLAVKLKQQVKLSEQAADRARSLALENEKNAREKEEAALLAQNEQLRSNLLRSISHDLRTPLTSISGNASNLLSHEKQFDEEMKLHIYQDIYDDSMWLVSLVENILSITRIEEDRMDLNLSAELLDEILEEALRHTGRHSEEHIIRLHKQTEFLLVRVDARLIIQVVTNILDNAIKYTPPGSRIDITMSRRGDKAEVRIADNGPGIEDEQKERVFEMFYTGGSQVADSGRSMGLGLALCRSIINAHQGTIRVEDNKPQGSVFVFTLPVREVSVDGKTVDFSCRG